MQDDVSAKVLNFYRLIPFNDYDDEVEEAGNLLSQNMVEYLIPVNEHSGNVVEGANSVLELGCGTGWLSNSIALFYDKQVTAVDFNPTALSKGQKVAQILNTKVDFICEDLFRYVCPPQDLVISNGVLHHTADCAGGIRHCIELLKPGGHVFLGLYHKYGRKPFLDYFRALRADGYDEDYIYKRFLEMDARQTDMSKGKSWFLDQVMHPFETQHTLKEVMDIFEEEGVELIYTSINGYQPYSDLEELFAKEKTLEKVGEDYLQADKFYPGFFYVLGRRYK